MPEDILPVTPQPISPMLFVPADLLCKECRDRPVKLVASQEQDKRGTQRAMAENGHSSQHSLDNLEVHVIFCVVMKTHLSFLVFV